MTSVQLLRDSLRGEFGMSTYILCVNSLWNVFIVYKRVSTTHKLRKTIKTRDLTTGQFDMYVFNYPELI